MNRRLALLAAGLCTVALPAPARAATTAVGRVYQWGSTSCAPTGPVASCTHAYSTAPPPLYGAPCTEWTGAGSPAPTCTVTFDGTSTQVGLSTPVNGPTCVGRGTATVTISSGLAGGTFTLDVDFLVDRGIANFTGATDAGTTHVEVNGTLSGQGICTGATGGISDLAMTYAITY